MGWDVRDGGLRGLFGHGLKGRPSWSRGLLDAFLERLRDVGYGDDGRDEWRLLGAERLLVG